MKSSIINSIKSLPPLSKTIIDVNRIHANPQSSIDNLVKAIKHDPMIMANLLKAANSPLYSFVEDIRNASQAVSLFGMSITHSIVVSNSLRKLLNVDMQPYGITSERFAEISELQSKLMMQWYEQIDKKKAEKLYLASFLQETGKILIASDIIQDDETTSFYSEVELSNNLAQVEKMYVDVTTAEITAKIFEYWNFDSELIEMIKYTDAPQAAPEKIKEYATALHIVKAIVPVNKPFDEVSINIGLKKAHQAGYNHELLEDAIDDILDQLEK